MSDFHEGYYVVLDTNGGHLLNAKPGAQRLLERDQDGAWWQMGWDVELADTDADLEAHTKAAPPDLVILAGPLTIHQIADIPAQQKRIQRLEAAIHLVKQHLFDHNKRQVPAADVLQAIQTKLNSLEENP